MKGILSLPAEQYFKADGISKSDLDNIAYPNTPAHFKWHMNHKNEDEQTEAQLIGQLTHRCILEPDTIEEAFHVKPTDLKLNTKAGIEWKEAHLDRPIVDQKTFDKVFAMRDAVWAHPMAKRLLKGARTEACLFEEDSNSVLRKGRLDALPHTGSVIPDLKTTDCAQILEFEKSIFKYRYHVQAAYYIDLAALCGIEKKDFAFICVEKEPPYCVAVYQLDPEIIELGRRDYQDKLALYRNCLAEDHWPAYSTDINMIGIPEWARRQMEVVL